VAEAALPKPRSSTTTSAEEDLLRRRELPRVLVYDKEYVLKYALAGSPGKGLLYNWKYHQFTAIDPFLARVQVSVSLDPTDICYGFYSYQEPDIVFTDLDVNPFTNQNVRNRIVQLTSSPTARTRSAPSSTRSSTTTAPSS
jgi:hypothetical protein